MNLKLVFEFESLDELAEFIKEQKDFNDWKTKKQLKKEIENRGAHQKAYHQLAKQYQLAYPNVSYRECLKQAIQKSEEETGLKKE